MSVDYIVMYPSLVTGAVLWVIYAYRCYKTNHIDGQDLSVVVNCFLGGGGLVGGVLLFGSAFSPDLRLLIKELNVYIAIAGATVIIVTWRSTIPKVFFPTAEGSESRNEEMEPRGMPAQSLARDKAQSNKVPNTTENRPAS